MAPPTTTAQRRSSMLRSSLCAGGLSLESGRGVEHCRQHVVRHRHARSIQGTARGAREGRAGYPARHGDAVALYTAVYGSAKNGRTGQHASGVANVYGAAEAQPCGTGSNIPRVLGCSVVHDGGRHRIAAFRELDDQRRCTAELGATPFSRVHLTYQRAERVDGEVFE